MTNRESVARGERVDSVALGEQADVRMAHACGENLDENLVRPGRRNRYLLSNWDECRRDKTIGGHARRGRHAEVLLGFRNSAKRVELDLGYPVGEFTARPSRLIYGERNLIGICWRWQ